MSTKRAHHKKVYFLLVLLGLGVGTFAYAQLNVPEVVTIETVHVFPESVTADGWKNADSLVIQNVSELALYQEFNTINSAYLDPSAVKRLEGKKQDIVIEPEPDEPEVIFGVPTSTIATQEPSGATTTTTEVVATTSPSSSDEVEATTTEATAETIQVTESEATSTTATPSEESTDVESEPSSSTTVFRRLESAFTLAFSSVTELLPFMQSSTSTPEEDTLNQEEIEVVEPGEEVNLATSTEETVELIQDTPATATSSVVADSSTASTTASTTEAATTTEAETVPVTEPSLPIQAVTEPDEEVAREAEVCTERCGLYQITLQGFGLPIFDDGLELDGAQLRMSMAAKRKSTRDAIQSLQVLYTFDAGETWSTAGDIIIDDEASNSINGGYYLFGLPEINDPDLLNSLQIQIVYNENPAELENIFIDSIWLELFTASVEAGDPAQLLETFEDGYQEGMLSGDELLNVDGEIIVFDETDENAGETLIIKSDDVVYEGLTKTTTYFNVTNTARSADAFSLKTYFPAGVGEVTALQEWNQNKPRVVVIPEYRPYVYHCEAGWAQIDSNNFSTIEELSTELVDTTTEEAIDSVGTTTDNKDNSDVSTTTFERATSTELFLSEQVIEVIATSTAAEEAREAVIDAATTTPAIDADGNVVAQNYSCLDTQVIRACDYLDGDDTACHVQGVKVDEHIRTQFDGGWEDEKILLNVPEEEEGFFSRVGSFFGFGPDKKEIPDRFESRSVTDDTFRIAPGETKYFKMDIAFPPLSRGEFWIEAIGDREYGLLDPFWNSQWDYRLPVTIDNTNFSDDRTEHQVRFSLDNSLTDFWSNVNDDGSDVRFVQETITNEDDTWYDTSWASRMAITVDSAQVDSDLTDFPIYIDLSTLGATFFNDVQSDGADIRITSDNGRTELPLEVVDIDTGAETGELHFRASSVSSSVDTTFYIYFNNPGAAAYDRTDTYGSENVWTNNFLAVYHFEEDATGTGNAGLYIDATANNHDGDDENASDGKTGRLGAGQEFGDTQIDYISLPNAVLDGETDVTQTWWHQTSQTGSQAIVSGAQGPGGTGNNEYLTFFTGSTGYNFYNDSVNNSFTITNHADGSWHHFANVRNDTSNVVNFYRDGVPEVENPNALTMSTLSIASGGLLVGQEQDTVGGGFQTTQNFEGTLDELRFASTLRDDQWVSAEFTNQDTPTTFYSTSTPENLAVTTFTELDFWFQHFSTTTDEADIWLQVANLPGNASTTVYMYYGNAAAPMGSDEFAPFTYSTTTDTYYVVHNDVTQPITVYSLVDNNVLQVDGGTEILLDKGDSTTISTYTGTTVVSTLGPITSRQGDNEGEPLLPIAFATTTHVAPSERNTEEFHIYSPFGSSTVEIYDQTTLEATVSVATGTVNQVTNDIAAANAAVLESTLPILLYAEGGNNDSYVSYPPTVEDLYGFDSNAWYISTASTSTDYDIYCSGGGSSLGQTVTRGDEGGNTGCTAGNDSSGDSVRITGQTNPVSAIQQADSDGTESTVFLPEREFGTEYYIPVAVDYVAAICSPRYGTSTIEIYDSDGGTPTETATCTAGGEFPGSVRFTNGGAGDDLRYSAGTRIVSSNGVPFYTIYDHTTDDDETNTWSSVQARKYSPVDIAGVSFGAQEVTIDAEYDQLSYGWYENLDAQTPTSTWPLGEGSFATEGVPITGSGAVSDEAVLRLRINLASNVSTGTASSTAFKLQYAQTETCTLSTNTWRDVGDIGSTTAAFTGYDNGAVGDGLELSSTTLASSTVFGNYEEQNLSSRNPNPANPGDVTEWDWVIQSKDADVNSNYCFRMVRSGGQELIDYTTYPELFTAGPPLQPTPLVYFDNERTAVFTPVLEFTATDAAGDDIDYEIQIDTDYNFGSPDVDRYSLTDFIYFENLTTPSDKRPFDSGAEMRFTSPTTLSASTTYWWRVRGYDPDGSNTAGEWSEPVSFTTDGSVSVSEWHQTTGDQFSTDALSGVATSATDVSVSSSPGSVTTTGIDFDDATVGNAWGEISWNDTETSGEILYQVEFNNNGSWTLVPDAQIPNNSVGTSTSPINILGLDTDTYNEIRIVATLTGATLSIEDITVIWGQRVNTPTLGDPFDNQKLADTTPTLSFSTTDPQGDDVEYQVSYGTDYTFTSSTTINTATSTSGDTMTYTIPSALTNGETYWWRVRARDPLGGNAYSPWSDPDAFTIDTGVTVSTWFQTTQEQFQQGTLDGLIASTSDSVEISKQIGEYGKLIVNNGVWTEVPTQVSYNDMVVTASVRYTPQGETQRSVRVRNKGTDSFEVLADNPGSTVTGTTTIDWIAMETGDWTIEDGSGGTRVVAGTYEDVPDLAGGGSYGGSGYGADVTFSPAFSQPPAVLATISSDDLENDSTWVIAHTNDGNTRNNPPTASALGLYMGRSAESAVHQPEDIDYIAMERGHGTNNGSEFDADVAADAHDEPPVTAENFNSAFASAPEVVVIQQGAEQGGNGAWFALYYASPPTATQYFPVSDESGDRNHTPEPGSAISFLNSSGIILRDETVGGDLTGEIYSEPVLFSDGAGPKFERLLWSSTTPGTSTVTMQLEYLTSTSSWALIPDGDLTGNSSGFTATTTVDLTGLNVVTYNTIRMVATLACASGNCPTLDDWTIEWSEGVTMSGTAQEYDRTTNVTTGTVRAAVNGAMIGNTGSISGGVWSINNVTAFLGDTITVWVSGAAEADEAVAVFKYDGVGDMEGVELYEQHLSISADEELQVTNDDLSLYDYSVANAFDGNEDIFYDVDGLGDITTCFAGTCSESNIYIGPGNTYLPATTTAATIVTHDLVNDGTLTMDGNSFEVSGSWDNNATSTADSSTVTMTATAGTESITDTSGTLTFNNLTFGNAASTATWVADDPYDLSGNLAVDFGTFDRSSSTINVGGTISTGAAGFWSGIATTTFDGTVAAQWSDANAVKQNVGIVQISGNPKAITLTSDVMAESVFIDSNDTLNAGGANTLYIAGDFTNTNTFLPQTGTVAVIGTSTNSTFTLGASTLYNLTASTTGNGTVDFAEANVSILGDFSVATGTVTLPTATTTIAGSFSNTGGVFAHNNGEVRFTSTGAETIELQGTPFLNSFYNLRFAGSGAWSFIDTNATTSNDVLISNGTVTFPSGQLAVGRNFDVTGSGAFAHNTGEVLFLIQEADQITSNGSSFNNTRFRSATLSEGFVYDANWTYRKRITISASQIDDDLVDFPVYLDLSDFDNQFFSNLNSDGGDIRITEDDGMTEVPREVVFASTTLQTGEVHFKAASLSSTTDSVFYIYYGNSGATDYATTDTYGAENVWDSNYEAVYHLNDTGSTYLDSTSNSVDGAGEGTDPTATSGQLGDGQSITAGRIDIGTGVSSGLNSAGEMILSAWINQNTSTGDQALISQFDGAGDTMLWADTGGANPGFCYYMSNYMPSDCQDVSAQNPGTWQHVTARFDGSAGSIYVDGTSIGAGATANTFGVDASKRWAIGSEDGDSGARQFNGVMDEVRISSVDRGEAWITAEYRNQATTTDFYTVATGASSLRTFADTNTTILGDVIIESGTVLFPTGDLNIGGSLDNNGVFDANGGTVIFDSVAGAETIAVSTSTFATVDFDSATGDFTIIEHATATVAAILTDVGSFTLNSGLTLESTGTFSNSVGGASTTWTGSTLRLSSGNDFAIKSKTAPGDVYATLQVTGDGDISMWNSSATVYDTQNTASIYSQDHAGNDGDLYIFGDYERTTGTEYWSYATDFDGTALPGGSGRQADVRIESGATVTISTSSLAIVGTSTASTTVDSQSGTFTLATVFSSLNATYFTMTGTDADGFQLLSSTTVTALANAEFSIGGSAGAVTVDATTIDTNPAAQYFDTNFVSVGGSVNVTLSGSPTSFWWFRDGTGDRYGEAFDNADGDPGSIRWDDSSYSITVSGTIYADDGSTTLGGPTCDGSTNNVRIVVDGGSYTDAVPCNGINGTYTFAGVSYIGDPTLVVYLDTNGGVPGSVITKTPSGDITDLDVYANRVMTRHEDTDPLTILDLAVYDEDDDTDLRFTAATGTLTVRPESGLYVFATTTFTPAGTVTLESGGSGAVYDGTMQIGDAATFTGAGTTTYQIGGSLLIEPSATFAAASSTVLMTATTSGKAINASAEVTFNELAFTGVGGAWNLNTDILVLADLEVATGTVTGTEDITLENGSFFGNGTVSLGSGTTLIKRANTFGGTEAWTLSNLTFGDSVNSEITTPAGTATTTVSGILTIASGHFLDAGNSVWRLTGSGNVFAENGTFLEDTSTVEYSGATGSNILRTTYYNLSINGTAGSPSFVAPSIGVQVLNDVAVGTAGTSTLDITTNDPLFVAGNDLIIGSLGTVSASDSATLEVYGSYDNSGSFISNGGLISFEGTGTETITSGTSDFANVRIGGTGTYTMTDNATSTTDFTIASVANYAQTSATTLAVGGEFRNNAGGSKTNWTGSTIHLYSGTAYEVSPKVISESYNTITVTNGTQPRVWNSTTTNVITAANSSLYSQDHNNVTGDLYIFGDYVNNSFDDFWSYERDFDGTTLGTSRLAQVFVEGGGSVLYTGGGLEVYGTTTASTTITNQGSGTYSLRVGGTASTSWHYATPRDLDSSGITFSGTPTVNDFAFLDLEAEINSATTVTVGGSVIDQNPAKNFTENSFASAGGVSGATNVTATGTSVSSWRFTNHTGGLDGEANDVDPAGDPGYIVWDDSAAVITISGTVYSDEGTIASLVCDGITNNVLLRVAGLTTYTTTCAAGTGAYSIAGVSFSSADTLTVYIDGETEQAATVSVDPISNISNLDLYENRVIVRHENSDPITIADMAVWDSSDDADIPFTAVDAGTDSLDLPADTKLIVWGNKDFQPTGDVTLAGAGAGAAYDGTLELYADASYLAANGETLAVGGSMILGTDATFSAAQSTTTFTTIDSGRTIDVNNDQFYNVRFTGTGSWSVTDSTFYGEDVTITNGTLTLPTGTTTINGSLVNAGGTFDAASTVTRFTATDSGNTITFGGSDLATTTFAGTGDWSITDTNATTTGSFTVATGTVTLPSGVLAVENDFVILDTITHNNGEVRLYDPNNAGTTLTLGGNDLTTLTIAGAASTTLTDTSATLLGDLTILSGGLTSATGTLTIGGSFDATGGVFSAATGTVLFNSSDAGETVDPGTNNFYNVVVSNATGGWTFAAATSTGNFALTNAAGFTLTSGETLTVNGVFSNSVGGANTTWTNTTLRLLSGTDYSVNNTSSGGDVYNEVVLADNTDLRFWNSDFATTTIAGSASIYSQDHAATDGDLSIYGDFEIPVTTEYWSYATDFDGTVLAGAARRAVTVSFVDDTSSSLIMNGGQLEVVGAVGATTTIESSGTNRYSFTLESGTFNANYYRYTDLDASGLDLQGTTTISSLSYGDFALAGNSGNLITLASTTLNANASLLIYNTRFTDEGFTGGVNVNLDATSSNAWRFINHSGDLSGENFDVDGAEDCDSLRWDDSSCLLLEQTHYRWRNDDGGLGVPSAEWF